jgi:nucleotide-binding universal stress UspA family protein
LPAILPDTILVAVDGSESSLSAARYAVRLAKRLDAEVHIVHVLEMSGAAIAGPAGVSAWTSVLLSMKESARGIVGLVVRQAQEAQVPYTVEVIEALDAAGGIVREAEEVRASLIVVGSHGRRGLSRLVLGSVAEKVARSASCPVLVAR